jgi:hypothetical protein
VSAAVFATAITSQGAFETGSNPAKAAVKTGECGNNNEACDNGLEMGAMIPSFKI